MKSEEIRNADNFDELLDIKYGKIGTRTRDDFEERSQYFVISEMLKRQVRKKVIFLKLKIDSAIFNFQHCIKFLSSDLENR